MNRFECISELERLGIQRRNLVDKWKSEKPPRPSHVIAEGERDLEALRMAIRFLRADEMGEMNRDAA